MYVFCAMAKAFPESQKLEANIEPNKAFRFINRSTKNLLVCIIDRNANLIEVSLSTAKENTNPNIQVGMNLSTRTSISPNEAEALVLAGASMFFDVPEVKFISIREENKQSYILKNYKYWNWFFIFNETNNLGFGDKIQYGEDIVLYNWKFNKYLSRFPWGSEWCGRIDNSNIICYLCKIEVKKRDRKCLNATGDFVKSGDQLFILARPDSQAKENLAEYDEMYASALRNIYFAKPRRVDDHRFIIAKECSKPHSPTEYIREGDIITIESLRFRNNYVAKTHDAKENFLVCRHASCIEDLDDHHWIILKKDVLSTTAECNCPPPYRFSVNSAELQKATTDLRKLQLTDNSTTGTSSCDATSDVKESGRNEPTGDSPKPKPKLRPKPILPKPTNK